MACRKPFRVLSLPWINLTQTRAVMMREARWSSPSTAAQLAARLHAWWVVCQHMRKQVLQRVRSLRSIRCSLVLHLRLPGDRGHCTLQTHCGASQRATSTLSGCVMDCMRLVRTPCTANRMDIRSMRLAMVRAGRDRCVVVWQD